MSNILVLHHSPLLGGGTQSLADLVTVLAREHDVTVCLPDDPPHARQLIEGLNIRVVAPPAPFPTFAVYNGGPKVLSRQFWQPALMEPMVRSSWTKFLKEQGLDAVIVNSIVLTALGPAIRHAGVRGICIIRETLPANSPGVRVKASRYLIRRYFSAVVFISQFDCNVHQPYMNLPSHILHDSVRPGAFRRIERNQACAALNLDPHAFNVLFTGGASWFKGLDVALRAMALIDEPDVKLVATGQRPGQPHRLRALARYLSAPHVARFQRHVHHLLADETISKKVLFTGPMSDMSLCYSACDALIFPATTPHQSRPLLEAAYYGLPAICTDYPQYSEHAAGWLPIPPGNAGALAKALMAVHSDAVGARPDRDGPRTILTGERTFESEAIDFARWLRTVV